MDISKEQIGQIDQLLKKRGIKYWDLRIEMVDHIVSDIELNATTSDFINELELSLNRIGWFGNLNNINKKGWQNVNKKYRKIYFQGFINFFKNPKTLLLFISLFVTYFTFSRFIEHQIFVKSSYILFCLPVFISFFEYYKTWKKKYGKSIHKDYGFSYIFLSFLILNVVFQFVRINNGFPLEYHRLILLFLIPFHLVLSYSGYQVYKKAISKVENMRKELSL
tara:strand:+ start:93333 stop:93998 length:666 start_codon:yes stop_codon:yes gene_type:complete